MIPKVVWGGPLDSSGYGTGTRRYLKTLVGRDDIDLYIKDLSFDREKKYMTEEEANVFMPFMFKETRTDECIFICHALPEWFPTTIYKRVIGMTLFETDRLEAHKVDKCNQTEEVWVGSRFNIDTFTKSGVTKPMYAIPYIVDPPNENIEPNRPPSSKDMFNFLYIGDLNWRKGWDKLIKAFCNTFSPNDGVCLTMKISGYPNRPQADMATQKIIDIKKTTKYPNVPVHLIFNPLSDDNMKSLMVGCDAFVLPSRGEGWGLPLAEAMSYGKPTIGTRWSGNLEFMNDSNSFLVNIDGLVEVQDEELLRRAGYKGHLISEPNMISLGKALLRVAENSDEVKKIAAKGKEDMKEFYPDLVGEILADNIKRIW